MPAHNLEYRKEDDDMRRQEVRDWYERVLRFEEPFVKNKEQKEAEEKAHDAECLKNFMSLAHDNPEWHLREMAKELKREMFCLMNRIPYEPGWNNGLPGYWDYRQQHGEEWMLNTRQRLPNE